MHVLDRAQSKSAPRALVRATLPARPKLVDIVVSALRSARPGRGD